MVERRRQAPIPVHLDRVPPHALALLYRRVRVDLLDLAEESTRLRRLVADDPVPAAPPELERHAGEGDVLGVVVGAPQRIGSRMRGRSPADLLARELPEVWAGRESREVLVPLGHVGRGVE